MPSCVHRPLCPGCPHFEKSEEASLREKSTRAHRALRVLPNAIEAHEIAGTIFSPKKRLHYRRRLKWIVSPEGKLGLYREGTHEVLDLPHCQIGTPLLLSCVKALRAELQKLKEHFFEGIDARELASKKILLTFVLRERTPQTLKQSQTILKALRHQGFDISAATQIRSKVKLLSGIPEPLEVQESGPFRDHLFADQDAYLYTSFGGFVQANQESDAAIKEMLVAFVQDSKSYKVLDAFAGSGSFSLMLAKHGVDAIAVESFAPSLEQLTRAADEQSFPARVEAHAQELATYFAQARSKEEAPPLVVVNPPRRGVELAARQAIAKSKAHELAYVSCEPATLARDLSHFFLAGFELRNLRCFDMIPQTREVETVAILKRGRAPLPLVLHETEHFVAVQKWAYEPTTPSPESNHSLLARLHLRPEHRGACVIENLDIQMSGVVLFAKSRDYVDALKKALSFAAESSSSEEFLALVRGRTHAKGNIKKPIRDRNKLRQAIARFNVVGTWDSHSLLRLRPEGTLQRQQFERHLASIEHPVLGDEAFGHAASNRHFLERFGLDRPFLHRRLLRFVDPFSQEPVVVECPLPPDLQLVKDRFESPSDSEESAEVDSEDPNR